MLLHKGRMAEDLCHGRSSVRRCVVVSPVLQVCRLLSMTTAFVTILCVFVEKRSPRRWRLIAVLESAIFVMDRCCSSFPLERGGASELCSSSLTCLSRLVSVHVLHYYTSLGAVLGDDLLFITWLIYMLTRERPLGCVKTARRRTAALPKPIQKRQLANACFPSLRLSFRRWMKLV